MPEWGEKAKVVAAVVSPVALVLAPILGLLDINPGPVAAIGLSAVSACAWILLTHWRRGVKITGLVIIAVLTGVLIPLILRYSQPAFAMAGIDTLDGDPNAYELTDFSIWDSDRFASEGITSTIELEIIPKYNGTRHYGRLIALISGDGTRTALEKPLWSDFSSAAAPARLALSLGEVISVSGLRANSASPRTYPDGHLPFEQATLTVEIVREAERSLVLGSQKITLRNAPWDFRSHIFERDGKRLIDVYVQNLGAAGDFTVFCHLARQDSVVSYGTHPMHAGATTIKLWNEPAAMVRLAQGAVFTETLSLPADLAPGHYIVELWPIKKQPFIKFRTPGMTWDIPASLSNPYQYADSVKVDHHVFIVNIPVVDPLISSEWERLRTNGIVDLGLALETSAAIQAADGKTVVHQLFQRGEIYAYDGKAYGLYGPILDHYRALLSDATSGSLRESAGRALGYPISPVQTVTSTLGTVGAMVEFRDSRPEFSSSAIYASSKGVAAVWGGIRNRQRAIDSGVGWLGFPVSDEQYFNNSTIQLFEGGYAVYFYPVNADKQRDWGRAVREYSYATSRGTLLDVRSDQGWQNTGVQLQAGERVSITQVDGEWRVGPDSAATDAGRAPFASANQPASWALAPSGALIGRIGETDEYRFTAGRSALITSPAAGTLYLAANDADYSDNSGFITVQIQVEPLQ